MSNNKSKTVKTLTTPLPSANHYKDKQNIYRISTTATSAIIREK